MNFSHPGQWLWLAAFAVAAVLIAADRISRKKQILKWFSATLVQKVFPFDRWRRTSFWTSFFLILSLLFFVVALTGPQLGQKLEEIKTRGSTVFILFDCSDSMLAEDLKPTRMERSKMLLTGLLERLYGSRVGIVAFAGEAYVFCPLTFDVFAAKQFLKSIEPGMVPQPGTRIGSAVRLALSKMPGGGSGAMVLLTDGEDHKSDPLGAAQEAKAAGVRIFTVGIGSEEGEPIPIKDASGNVTGYKKDKGGKIVLSKLDSETLTQMARATGGAYFQASQNDDALESLAQSVNALDQNPLLKKQNAYQDRYQWFLAAALFCLALSEGIAFFHSTGKLVGAALSVFLIFSASARAETFGGKISEGNRLYREEKYEEALDRYGKASKIAPEDKRADFNRGAAHYRLKDWEKAQEEFERSARSKSKKLKSKAVYNLGNAYFQEGKYAEAIRSYQDSLKADPNDADARENLKLALEFMKNPPPKSNQKNQKEGKGGQKEKDNAAQSQTDEKTENAKRILKGASDEDRNKPLFKPPPKENQKKEVLEDW